MQSEVFAWSSCYPRCVETYETRLCTMNTSTCTFYIDALKKEIDVETVGRGRKTFIPRTA